MTDDDQPDEIEQYSQESRQELRDVAAALATALERHTAALLEMRSGISTLRALVQLNYDIRQAAAAWDDAVFDHTGTFPIALESFDDDDEDDALDEEDEGGSDGAETPLAVSVMSRWDLDIIAPAALIQAGQAAHQRMNPSQSEADAATYIGEGGVGPALYAIVHEYGEPWFEMPGVGTVNGHRAYLRRDDDQPPLDESNQDYDQPPAAPTGNVMFSESW